MGDVALAWLAALAGATLIERQSRPASPWLAASAGALAVRLAVSTFLFAFFLAISWRPCYAAVASLVTVAIFVAISNAKLAYTYEPLVFSDLAFVGDLFRHATLFHTTFLGPAVVLGAIAAILVTSGLWFMAEAPIEAGWPARLALSLCWLALASAPLVPAVRRGLAELVSRSKPDPEVFADVTKRGLAATLAADAIAWLGEDRAQRIAQWSPASPAIRRDPQAGPADLVVAVQCESFMDLRRLGAAGLSLPNFDAACQRSFAWGRLGSAFAGGYTMRSEVSFLTGRPHRDFGYDRYYPYLNTQAYRSAGIPRALRDAGYETLFIHPFHRDFFRRHRAMPELGFSRMIMLEEFSGAEQVGAYVSDRAVGNRIVAEARAARGPAFLFAATMENHEPWGPGRFDGVSDPVGVYQRHVENGDRLLGRLIETFEAWPGRVALAFYGDHVPLLKEFADPFPDSDTDFVLLELGRDAGLRSPGNEMRLEIAELPWRLLDVAGLTPARRAPA